MKYLTLLLLLRNLWRDSSPPAKKHPKMMSSSDIFWTDSVRFLRLLRDEGDEVFALSRHDMVPEHRMSNEGCPSDTVLTRNQCFDYAGGHDGFAFRVPLQIGEVSQMKEEARLLSFVLNEPRLHSTLISTLISSLNVAHSHCC